MRRLKVSETVKVYATLVGVGTLTIDAALLLASRAGYHVPGSAYIDVPLAAIALAGVPASISLFERFLAQVGQQRASVQGFEDSTGAPVLRQIKLALSGKPAGTMLAHSVPFLFGGGEQPEQPVTRKPAAWWITLDGVPVTIREAELRAFLDVAYKRNKYQFSQNYWTRDRRPPMDRRRYDALMYLLTSAGLVDGRLAGASGRLLAPPRHAITYLKFESRYRVQ